jgi:hypothetical protein
VTAASWFTFHPSDLIMPRVSIIIVSWNALPLLRQCLPSVVATDYPDVEVILADNASTDGSAAWVREHYPAVSVVRHPENWLFCKGNNEAVPHATGDYILFLNNDVEVPRGWLHPLVEAMEQNEQVGAVQPKLLQYDDRGQFEYAGAAGGYLDRLGYPFARGRIFFNTEPDEGQYDAPRTIFWATGAAIMLRRSALNEVGLFDERFEMHMEEIDLCWRLQRHGYRVCSIPASTAYHIGGGSLPQGNVRKVYYNFRNSLLMLYKNLPPSAWRRVFPQRVAFDSMAALRALASGRPREASSIVRAYRDAHRMSCHYTLNRPRRTEDIVPLPYRGRIVVDYFLRGRRCFQDLPADQFHLAYRA